MTVDPSAPETPVEDAAAPAEAEATPTQISVRSIIAGTVLAAVFSYLTVYIENRHNTILTSAQIAVLPYVLIVLTILVINPVMGLCHWVTKNVPLIRWFTRPMSVVEILVIFIMGSVSAGLSTFGLASQLMPLAGSYYNEHWNNDQSKWDLYITPYLNEAYFVSEPGIQKAAIAYKDANEATEAVRKPLKLAQQIQVQDDRIAAADAHVAELEAKVAAAPDDGTLAAQLGSAKETKERLVKGRADVAAEWETMTETYDLPAMSQVLEAYPALVKEREAAEAIVRAEMATLEKNAFAKVQTFRRGLPDDMRAFPGVIKMPGEDYSTYMRRIRRFDHGTNARRMLEAAHQDVVAGKPLPTEKLTEAIAELRLVADPSELQASMEELDAKWEAANAKYLELEAEEKAAVLQKDLSFTPSETKRLADRIKEIGQEKKALNNQKKKITENKGLLASQIAATERVGKMIDELDALVASPPTGDALAEQMAGMLGRFSAFDASWRRLLFGEVPYSVWIRPLTNWAILVGLTYIALMAFNVLIFRQWAYNERLIYPLAQLPELLAGSDGQANEGEGSFLPKLYKNGFFWAGFGVAAVVLSWNVLVKSGSIPDIKPIPLKFKMDQYLAGDSFFSGLKGSVTVYIFFTMIGLAFLIPANISFSLWFFYVMYFVQLLVMVRMGKGTDIKSFPTEWFYTFNFQTAIGGGALVVFALVTLWKCRTYLFCAFMPSAVKNLESAEQKELRISSAVFMLASILIVLMLSFGMGANIWWTIFSMFVILTVTVGLVRAVTEGGILGFQANVSPFHFIRSMFGMDKQWSASPHFIAVFIYYAVLFLDIKTFIAPTMANSIKIRDDLHMKRLRFHVSIALSIVVAASVAILLHLMFGYDKGADQMHGWFYNGYPEWLFKSTATMVKNPPVDTSGVTRFWAIVGAIVMVLLIWGRQTWFWLPHPIGMIMLVNPRMSVYWFPILLGWVCKRMVTKYGNKDTYDRVRGFFVGLIVAELLIIFISTLLSILLQRKMGIDLNIY